ncbi:MAG: flavodoxin family protein [Candidatus Omnitrophica bacterium]|nr:flavodoxin family protein [Candidatus Omnitrophota bacterium]
MQRINNLFSRVYKKQSPRQPYVLGLSGSPRIQGNSEILLDKALSGAVSSGARIEKIRINDCKFIACQDCENVRNDGYCSINDQFQKIYQAIQKADIIFLSSPIYFGSLTAQTKMLIDRFQCHWRAVNQFKTLPQEVKKQGYFLSIQAEARDVFFTNAALIVRNFFATAGIKYCGELFCPGVEEKGMISQYPDKLNQAFVLGENLYCRI